MSESPTSNALSNSSPAPVADRQGVSPVAVTTMEPDTTQEPRRLSIQFKPHVNVALPQGKEKPARERRRMSSPPPPPVFRNRVSFDTFDRPADFIEENSFTLIAKHKDYEYTKRSRTFLCGCDDNEYSEYALQWLIDELVDDGDEIVCLRVVEKDDSIAGDRSVEKGRYRSEAEALMRQVQEKNHENKAISLILEFAVGKVQKVIDEMINMYEPAILVVGTKGRSLGGFQGLLPGSVSKYCLQHSPVPVIVVRPSSKRDKARVKRAQDPSRHAYRELLEKSGSQGGPLLDASNRNSFIAEEDPASDDEAAAVAAAIGYKPQVDPSPLAQVETATPRAATKEVGSEALGVEDGASTSVEKVDSVDTEGTSSTDDARNPSSLGVVMKSPELQNLESPDITDSSSSSDEEDQGGVPTTEPAVSTDAAAKSGDESTKAAEAKTPTEA